MALRFSINCVSYMKSTVFSLCFFLSLPVTGQISDVLNDQICSHLNIDKKTRPYFIDTTIQIGSIKIYSVTPYPGGFSHLMPFFQDSLFEIFNVSTNFNRIPYEFEVYETQNGCSYLITKAYIETLTYSKIEIFVLKIQGNVIAPVFNDVIYYKSKIRKRFNKTVCNSFELCSDSEKIIMRKKANTTYDFNKFIRRYGLPYKRPTRKLGFRKMKSTELKLD